MTEGRGGRGRLSCIILTCWHPVLARQALCYIAGRGNGIIKHINEGSALQSELCNRALHLQHASAGSWLRGRAARRLPAGLFRQGARLWGETWGEKLRGKRPGFVRAMLPSRRAIGDGAGVLRARLEGRCTPF